MKRIEFKGERNVQDTAIAVIAIIASILFYAVTKPSTFHVERSIDVKAPPENIFPLINDFHKWDAWTPYNKDPAIRQK